MLRLVLFLLAFSQALFASRVWQPIIDYTISFPGDRPDAAPIINPFENFTHFSSDFGWMGLGSERIDSKGGVVHVRPRGEWTGAWHSLAGLAVERGRTLDPTDLLGMGGEAAKRCAVHALAVNAGGRGLFRLELLDAGNQVVWRAAVELNEPGVASYVFPIDPERVGAVKFMNWVAEPGCELRLSSIGFLAERPEMSIEEWAFRISLGKLRRCHDAASGLTRDRGHLRAGDFDSVASTGMHALASAAAAADGMLAHDQALREIATTVAALRHLRTASGWLPHFTTRTEGGVAAIAPGTEFSTVDTAIALQSLLLATRILRAEELHREVVRMISAVEYDAVTDPEGWIFHGFQDDGKTPLPATWQDWGGETALILAMEAMIPQRAPRGSMRPTGQPYRGVGFIAEIQSLFYPDFDNPVPDRVSGISWPTVRRKLLTEQMAYPKQYLPESAAARAGVFGLSAGETGMPGAGYTANGVEVMGVRWLHPHYMMMGLALSAPELYPQGLGDLSAKSFLFALGLPENIEVDFRFHNPMQGSLNAAFEAISAYHGWKKRGSTANRIDQASLEDPLMRKGAARFYGP